MLMDRLVKFSLIIIALYTAMRAIIAIFFYDQFPIAFLSGDFNQSQMDEFRARVLLPAFFLLRSILFLDIFQVKIFQNRTHVFSCLCEEGFVCGNGVTFEPQPIWRWTPGLLLHDALALRLTKFLISFDRSKSLKKWMCQSLFFIVPKTRFKF